MLTVKIRAMQKEDIDGVIAIESLAYGEHHWSKDSFLSELSNDLAKYFCAVNEENKLVGYLGSWHILEEAHLTNLAVSPDFRRKSVAEALIKTLVDECYKNGVKYITLEVRVGNKGAIALYEKYGFKSFGIRKGYYQDNNEDALIMWTENVFYDKFKSNYEDKIEKLKGRINIL